KIKERDFIMINQELVALIKAGYPILKCIQIILKRVKNIHLKELLMKVENEIRGGKSLSEAFVPYEKNFSTVYIASLMAGERSGNLAGTINRYIDYAKVVSQTKARIRAALTYPTLLILFAFILLMILLNFILPRFTVFYADFDAELPAITRGLLAFSQFLRANFLFLIAFVFLLYLVYSLLKRNEKTLVIRDRIKLKIPYGGSILVESGVSLFSRTLGLILEAGISLVSAVGIANRAVPNYFIIQKSRQLPELIKDGKSLSESLSRIDFFPPLSLDMIQIGEASANLEGMLSEVADYYDEKIQTKIDTFVSLIEPLVIVFMGLIVAAMLLSVYLPIFNIIRVTG
ncbi:MAG: type II secretion system F family protein, partial [Candidatus Aminicenantes bacterium]|nr:type II secretion system F family protein [Candidatus Aminicenantes bacterium]